MRSSLVLLLLLCPAVAAGQEPGPRPPLPEDVAAIVVDEIISMDEFRGALVRRYAGREEGRKALENLVERIAVDAERERRGIRISDGELEAYVKKVEGDVRRLSRGTQTLQDLLAKRNVTREEFLETSRDFLARQRMAAADLGLTGEVSAAQLGVWVEDLKKRSGVVVGGPGLPAGAYARVGERIIGAPEYGGALVDTLSRSELEGALWDLVIARAVEQRLAKEEVELTDEDVRAAVAELEREFRADPRFANARITFEQYVQGVRRMTVAELGEDPLFRAQAGLAKSIREKLTAEEIRAYYEEHRGRYGERRRFIHLLIKADDRPKAFGRPTRSYREARRIIDALHAQVLGGAPFETLVRRESEDRSNYARPERVMTVNRETPLPDALRSGIFQAPVGEVVGPIRSPYGYHLVKVVEAIPSPTFEEIRGDVARDLVRERRTQILLSIRQDDRIRIRY